MQGLYSPTRTVVSFMQDLKERQASFNRSQDEPIEGHDTTIETFELLEVR